ncbi:MAG: hypothetical protein ACRD24_14410 [Terriglobales bacterium]
MTDQPSKPAPPPDAGHIPMTEEMDSARWTLPPILPVFGAAAVIAILVLLYTGRPAKPQTIGSITRVVAAAQPAPAAPASKKANAPATPVQEQSVMVVVHLHLENAAERSLYVRGIRVKLELRGGEIEEDEAASAVDHDRYLQAFPDLQAHKIAALPAETKIAPGAQQDGMVMFAFPVSRESFDQRKSLTVTVDLYDRKPLVLEEKK